MPGTILRVQAQGRISCVVTTPGTARFDCRLNNVVCFDTGAMALNTVAKTTLPWWLDIQIVCRAAGVASTASFFGFAQFQSEAVVGSALASTAGAQGFVSSVSTGPEGAPAPISTNVDTTVSCPFEMFFTQTVATGSFTVHNYVLSSASLALT
jgi:hypothetical protein